MCVHIKCIYVVRHVYIFVCIHTYVRTRMYVYIIQIYAHYFRNNHSVILCKIKAPS